MNKFDVIRHCAMTVVGIVLVGFTAESGIVLSIILAILVTAIGLGLLVIDYLDYLEDKEL